MEEPITESGLNEIEVWFNEHYRPCSDEWPRMKRVINSLRKASGWVDPDIRPLTLDAFTELRKRREAELELGLRGIFLTAASSAPSSD